MGAGRKDVRVVFRRPFAPPKSAAYALSLITQKQWESLSSVANMWRVDIRQEPAEPRTDGVSMQYRLGTRDNYLSEYTVKISAEERLAVDRVRAKLQDEVNTLQAKGKLTTAEQDRVDELNARIASLADTSFWREGRNAFGDGASNIYRACAEANVPSHIQTNGRLDADRPFTLWLHRCKPLEDQSSSVMTVDFGGWWRLEFTADKGCKLYRKTTRLSATQRGSLEQELEAIEDTGRLTPTDRQNIKQIKDDIALTIATAKKAGRKTPKQWTASESAFIKQQKAAIKSLQDSKKGISQAGQARKKEILDELYEDTADVQLYTDTASTWNRDQVITIIPQARGFLTIANAFSANYWTYEDKLVTKTQEYGRMLGSDFITIKTNGGAYWMKWDYANVDTRGAMVGAKQTVGHKVVTWRPRFVIDGWVPDGCTANFTANLLDAEQGVFQWNLELTSDGRFMPFVYGCRMELDAEPRDPSVETVILDTAQLPDTVLMDVTPKFDDSYKGRGYTITLRNIDGALSALLPSWDGAQVEVYESGKRVFTGVARDLEEDVINRRNGFVRFTCVDRWDLLNQELCWSEIVGDGKQLGAHMAEVLSSRGFTTEEMRIVSTPGIVLPKAGVGEEPATLAKPGDKQGGYLQDLIDKHALGLDSYFDQDGVAVLEPKSYTPSGVVFRTTHDLRNIGDHDYVITNLRSTVTKRDFYNYFVVIGDRLPESKKRHYTAYYADWVSVYGDRRDPRYLGYWKSLPPVRDNSLNSWALVNRVLRRTVEQYNQPLHELTFDTAYSTRFCIGLVAMLDGMKVQVTSVQAKDRRSGRVALTVKVL